MSSDIIIPGTDGTEIVVRSLLPGIQRYPLQVRRQRRAHPQLPTEGIHLYEAELRALICALAGGEVVIRLSREQIPALNDVAYFAREALTTIANDVDESEEDIADTRDALAVIAAIAAQLKALDAGEGA